MGIESKQQLLGTEVRDGRAVVEAIHLLVRMNWGITEIFYRQGCCGGGWLDFRFGWCKRVIALRRGADFTVVLGVRDFASCGGRSRTRGSCCGWRDAGRDRFRSCRGAWYGDAWARHEEKLSIDFK